MDPNQPPVQPPVQPPFQPSAGYSADYLNQIAPVTATKQRFSKIQMIIGGVLGALVIIVIGLSLFLNLTRTPSSNQTLAARLLTTETIVGTAQPILKSTELRTLNSNLKIFLTDTNRGIAEPLLKVKVDVSKLDKTIVASESGEELIATLDDARLNAVYDKTYAREMAYRLQKIMTLMEKIYKTTGSASYKEFLENAYKNLEPTQQAFEKFNAANG